MSNGNVFTEGSTAAPIQLEQIIRAMRNVLAQWKKNPKYMGLHMELIPYLAETSVQNLDPAYVQSVSDWKLAGGGCLSDETYNELNAFKNEVKEEILTRRAEEKRAEEEGDQEKAPRKSIYIAEGLNDLGINGLDNYLQKTETATSVSVYPAVHGSISAISCILSFSWDRLRREFALFQMGEADRESLCNLEEQLQNEEITEEDEDYQELVREKYKLDEYAGAKLEMSDAFRKYLMPKILLAAADCLEKDGAISMEEIHTLRQYATRLQEFILLTRTGGTRDLLGFGDPYGFRNYIYTKLPVIPILDAEQVLSTSNPGDTEYTLELNIVFKLNGINSPSRAEAKNPLSSVLRKIHSNEEDTKKLRNNMQLYALMYYLDHGALPDTSMTAMQHSMKQYKPVVDYNALARALSSAQMETIEPWTGYLSFDPISEGDAHTSSLIHLSDHKPDEIDIPVSCRIVRREFSKTDAAPQSVKYDRHSNDNLASVLLCQSTQLTTERNEQAFHDCPFCKIPVQLKTRAKDLEIGKEQNRIILYDLAYATIFTLFMEISMQIEQENVKKEGNTARTEFLLARYTDSSSIQRGDIDEEQEYPKVPGSDTFLTAFGYAAEQAIQSDTLLTKTQGYIGGENSFKDKNTISSLMQLCDTELAGGFSSFIDGIGILYLTTRQCDRNRGGKKQEQGILSLLMTNGMEIITPEEGKHTIIRHLPNTNEICKNGEAYRFRKNMEMYKTLAQMQKDHVTQVIVLMDAPYMIPTTQSETSVVGLSNENFQTLEEDFPELTFFPMYIGTYQIRAGQKESNGYYTLRDLHSIYHNPDGSWNGGKRIPLLAYVVGHAFAHAGSHGYRTGSLYEVIRDYYSGRTGELIESYLSDTESGKKLRSKIFSALLFLHIITNEKYNKEQGEGKCSPFGRCKQDLAPGAILTYRRDKKGGMEEPDFSFNYAAYLSILTSIIEKKG